MDKKNESSVHASALKLHYPSKMIDYILYI